MSKSGREIEREAAEFYANNPKLLRAHVEAAKTLADAGVPVSGQLLTEFARYMRKMDFATLLDVLECYRDVFINSDDDYTIKNDTVAWLGRYLDLHLHNYPNFKITIRKSKMDKEQTDNDNLLLF